MAEQDEDPDGAAAIQRQFALLQEEMRRVMSHQLPEAGAPADSAASKPEPSHAGGNVEEDAQFRRIEAWLEDLRRGPGQPAAPVDPAVTEAIGRLRTSVEQTAAQAAEVGKRAEESATRLARAMQTQREAIVVLTNRVDQLARRRGRWVTPVAILIGAGLIAAAVLASDPDSTRTLIDRFKAIAFPNEPHAETSTSARVAQTGPPAETPDPPTAAILAPSLTTSTHTDTQPPPASSAAPEPAQTPQMAGAPEPPKSAPPPNPPSAPLSVDSSSTPSDASAASTSTETAAVSPSAPALLPAPVASPPPAAAPVPAPAPAVEQPLGRSHIVLRANSDTWVEVRNRQGGTLLSRILHSGDNWTVPDQDSLTLSTGNAGGLVVLIDGNPVPSLGGSGVVRRDVPLDAELLRGGRAASEPPTHARPSTASR